MSRPPVSYGLGYDAIPLQPLPFVSRLYDAPDVYGAGPSGMPRRNAARGAGMPGTNTAASQNVASGAGVAGPSGAVRHNAADRPGIAGPSGTPHPSSQGLQHLQHPSRSAPHQNAEYGTATVGQSRAAQHSSRSASYDTVIARPSRAVQQTSQSQANRLSQGSSIYSHTDESAWESVIDESESRATLGPVLESESRVTFAPLPSRISEESYADTSTVSSENRLSYPRSTAASIIEGDETLDDAALRDQIAADQAAADAQDENTAARILENKYLEVQRMSQTGQGDPRDNEQINADLKTLDEVRKRNPSSFQRAVVRAKNAMKSPLKTPAVRGTTAPEQTRADSQTEGLLRGSAPMSGRESAARMATPASQDTERCSSAPTVTRGHFTNATRDGTAFTARPSALSRWGLVNDTAAPEPALLRLVSSNHAAVVTPPIPRPNRNKRSQQASSSPLLPTIDASHRRGIDIASPRPAPFITPPEPSLLAPPAPHPHPNGRARLYSQRAPIPLGIMATTPPTCESPSPTTASTPPPPRTRTGRMTDEELMARARYWRTSPRPPTSSPIPLLTATEQRAHRATTNSTYPPFYSPRRDQLRLSRTTYQLCAFCPLAALLFAYGAFDPYMRRRSHGRFREMDPGMKRTSLRVWAPLSLVLWVLLITSASVSINALVNRA